MPKHAEPLLEIGPLDHLLINAIVDTRNGVEGALDENDLHAAVDEFVKLNGRRYQSYYHAGFRDAIFERPPAEPPADNAACRRWYWTGVILGWARTEAWQRIVQAYDEQQTVRGLGDGIDHASRSAGLQIATALRHTKRHAELPTFVGATLARQPDVHQLLLEAGTETLRNYDAGTARQIFALLMDCAGSSPAPSATAKIAITVRRRMAHCLRLLGEHLRAEELLEELLEVDHDANNRAMVHADLGLLKGHFLLLDDVFIPSDSAARQDIVDRLRAGESDFRRATDVEDAAYAAHGHYCLGILALADDHADDSRYEIADSHLERARARFNSADRHYPATLKARTTLYVGVSKAQRLTAQDVRHAARMIESSLRADADMPKHLIAPTVEAIALSNSSIADVAALLLETGGDAALDALARPPVVPAEELHIIAEQLWERARRSKRSRLSQAEDLRLALTWFLRLSDVKQSRNALDALEGLATDGIAVQEFLEILDDPAQYDPAWNADDAAMARHRLLDAQGEYIDALQALRPVFFRNIHDDDLDNAAAILDWAGARPLPEIDYEDMQRSYAAARERQVEMPSDRSPKSVAVWVIGGDESLAKSNAQVQSEIDKRDSNISVDFLTIDWRSDWTRTLEEVKRKLPNFNAVVLMRFMRTTFGEHVRRLCSDHSVPWRFCYGGGRTARIQAVLRAAEAGRDGVKAF